MPIFYKQHFQAGEMEGFRPPDKDCVLYNGTLIGDWYRASWIFDDVSIEARPAPWLKDYKLGFKIIDNDCDCHPNVVRAGRMGRWQAGELTHHAFATALEAITTLSGTRG